MNPNVTAAIVASLAGGGIVGAVLSFIRDVRAQRATEAKIPLELDSSRIGDLVRQVEIVERINERVAKRAEQADADVEAARGAIAQARSEIASLRGELAGCRDEIQRARDELRDARRELEETRRRGP